MSGNRLPVATSEKSTRPASKSSRLMLIASPSLLANGQSQDSRHPEVLAVLHGQPRRMGHKRWSRGHPSRRRASARLLGMTAECVATTSLFFLLLLPLRQRDLVVQ